MHGEPIPEEQKILAGPIFDQDQLEEMREDIDEDEVKNLIEFEGKLADTCRNIQKVF